MHLSSSRHAERGAVLAVSMIFLLVVTIIAVVAARNSTFGTKMASNLQDAYSSFQSAEAGILATMLLSRTANDPFKGDHVETPFAAYTDDDHPLRELNDEPDDVTVKVFFTGGGLACPRDDQGFSAGLLDCDYYRIESEHDVDKSARTKVDMGVVKTLIGSARP